MNNSGICVIEDLRMPTVWLLMVERCSTRTVTFINSPKIAQDL